MAKNEECVEMTQKIAEKIRNAGIRVSVDDTDATVGKKVRLAKQDWCSYAAVIGEQEIESLMLRVYVRSENKDINMNVDDLIDRILEETEDMPVRPMYMPSNLSKRCVF